MNNQRFLTLRDRLWPSICLLTGCATSRRSDRRLRRRRWPEEVPAAAGGQRRHLSAPGTDVALFENAWRATSATR